MSSTVIHTVVKMMESLPVEIQERVAEHIREYVSDLQDEARWDESFGEPRIILLLLPVVQNTKSLKGKQAQWIMSSYEVGDAAVVLS